MLDCVVTAGAPKSDVGCPDAADPKSDGPEVTVDERVPNGAGAEVVAPKEKPNIRIFLCTGL